MINMLDSLFKATLEGSEEDVSQNVQDAILQKINPKEILQEGLISAMGEVGRLFEEGEYYVPEMLNAAKAMKAGLKNLRPHLIEADVQPIGKIIIGTVQGDLHDIGKNLVAMMLEGAGF